MIKTIQLSLFSRTIILLRGCSYTEFSRGAYDGLHTRQCIEQTGAANYDQDYPRYDEYQQHRSEVPE